MHPPTASPLPDDAEPPINAALSALIDRAVEQLAACTDEPCRRAWRAVLAGLEEQLPADIGRSAT